MYLNFCTTNFAMLFHSQMMTLRSTKTGQSEYFMGVGVVSLVPMKIIIMK